MSRERNKGQKVTFSVGNRKYTIIQDIPEQEPAPEQKPAAGPSAKKKIDETWSEAAKKLTHPMDVAAFKEMERIFGRPPTGVETFEVTDEQGSKSIERTFEWGDRDWFTDYEQFQEIKLKFVRNKIRVDGKFVYTVKSTELVKHPAAMIAKFERGIANTLGSPNVDVKIKTKPQGPIPSGLATSEVVASFETQDFVSGEFKFLEVPQVISDELGKVTYR